ncbi:MAG: glutathione S-transferase [Pseudomonadota bacterium]
MITVHHLENSRSQRILWLLEEIGAPYEVRRYDRDPQTSLAPQALKDVHPLGKSPVIDDDGRVIAETGAIIEYLVGRYAPERLEPPAGSYERDDYVYWLHFAEGSAMPNILLKLIFDKIKTTPMPFFAKPIAKTIADNVLSSFVEPNLKDQLAFIEAHLTKNEWFAGAVFSAADIMMSFPLEGAASRGVVNARHPKIKAFLDRIAARPAYAAALERGGPYQLAA